MTTPETATRTPTGQPWIPGDDTFGARLALVRQRMGWGNVAEAAQACDIPVPSWRNWERDGRTPRGIVEIASKIAERSGCDYLWLLTGRRVNAVVTSSGSGGQTTVPTLDQPKRPMLTGQMKRAVPPASSRRPARLTPMIPELMTDERIAEELLAQAA